MRRTCSFLNFEFKNGGHSLIIGLLFAGFLLFIIHSVFAADLEMPLLGSQTSVSGPGELIKTIFIYGLGMVGIVALFAIVFGGFHYVFGSASETAKTEGKKWIWGAVLGILLLFSSYLILKTINPALVSLKDPYLEKIEIEPYTPPEWTQISPQTGLQVGPQITYGLGSLPNAKFAQQDDKQLFEQYATPALHDALSKLPFPVTVSEFNNYSGHVANSAHYDNRAVDIWVGNLTPQQTEQVMQTLNSLSQTDELFYAGFPQYNRNDGIAYNGNSTYNHTRHIHFATKN